MKKAAGFFIELNAAIFLEDVYNKDTMTSKNETGFGFGSAIGGKFLTKNNWIGELYAGIGKTFVNEENSNDYYPRLGITIGKRF